MIGNGFLLVVTIPTYLLNSSFLNKVFSELLYSSFVGIFGSSSGSQKNEMSTVQERKLYLCLNFPLLNKLKIDFDVWICSEIKFSFCQADRLKVSLNSNFIFSYLIIKFIPISRKQLLIIILINYTGWRLDQPQNQPSQGPLYFR